MTTRTVRTTLTLPADLLEQVDRAIQAGKARNRSLFVANVLRHALAAADAVAIDAELAAIATDAAYATEAVALAEECAQAEWEALRLAEARE